MAHCEVSHIVTTVVFCLSEKQSQMKVLYRYSHQRKEGPEAVFFVAWLWNRWGGSLSLYFSREVAVHPCGQWNESVNCHSEAQARPLLPHRSFTDAGGTGGSGVAWWGLLLPVFSDCTLKVDSGWETCAAQTSHLQQRTMFVPPPLSHSSSQKLAIILKRHFQTRLTQLWFSVGRDCFVLYFSFL
jgi:hypothetical protein